MNISSFSSLLQLTKIEFQLFDLWATRHGSSLTLWGNHGTIKEKVENSNKYKDHAQMVHYDHHCKSTGPTERS